MDGREWHLAVAREPGHRFSLVRALKFVPSFGPAEELASATIAKLTLGMVEPRTAVGVLAEECISYAIPAFRLHGKVVAGFAATTKGCSYFPFSGSTLATLADELEGYDMTKSSLHFDPAEPLPATLLRKLIKARIAET